MARDFSELNHDYQFAVCHKSCSVCKKRDVCKPLENDVGCCFVPDSVRNIMKGAK